MNITRTGWGRARAYLRRSGKIRAATQHGSAFYRAARRWQGIERKNARRGALPHAAASGGRASRWLSAAAVALLCALAALIKSGLLLDFEKSVLLDLHWYARPSIDSMAQLLCASVTVVSVGVLLCLCWRGRWQNALFWLASAGGAAILGNILKRAMERSRPDLWDAVYSRHNFGFPSGHATHSMAILLAALILLGPSRLRRPLLAAGLLYVALVGLCRMYLGLHYPTDVLGGWSLAAAWVCGLASLREFLSRGAVRRPLLPELAEAP